MKENNNTTCDPCERDFERSIEELVKEGKAPSHAEREEKEHEVKAAFSPQHAAEHSGKQCTSQHASTGHSGAEHGAHGQTEQTSGQRPGMDSSAGDGRGMSSSNGGHLGMESSTTQNGENAGMESPTGGSGEQCGREQEERKTRESSDAAVHAMAGSTSDLK